MAVGKEIRTKINSVKSTQKITRAMELVAASKMRKAQDKMAASKPYAKKIRDVIQHLAAASVEYRHPYMQVRPVQRVGYIVISSDRGLCGGLNINVFKKVLNEHRGWREQKVEVDYCLIGNKASTFFASVGGRIVASLKGLGDEPSLTQLLGAIRVMLDAYNDGKIDRLYVVYNEFVNTMVQQPTVQQLLPLLLDPDSSAQNPATHSVQIDNGNQHLTVQHHWDYLYEPDPISLLQALLTRFVESQIYQSVVENNACEQAARMVAMKAATDNAADMIGELQLIYNKARQAAITQELAEIVSGAAAV